MKQDLLEKFVREHRQEWDDQKAPPEIWENIVEHLPNEEEVRRSTSNSWKTVAILLGIFLVILLTYLLFFSERKEDMVAPQQILEYAELPDFNETEEYYMSAVFASEQKISEQILDVSLEKDLSLLDQSTNELREEYKTAQGGYKEDILRAIILNHQTKLQILERVLINIENSKLNHHEKIY